MHKKQQGRMPWNPKETHACTQVGTKRQMGGEETKEDTRKRKEAARVGQTIQSSYGYGWGEIENMTMRDEVSPKRV